MEKIFEDLGKQFPLLTCLQLRSGDAVPEDIAPFVGVILGAIEQRRHASFCFVFPKKTQIAPLTAVVYSLSKFAVEFPRLAEEYASKSFHIGQRVKVHPTGHVFNFGGLWHDDPTRFRLEITNHPGSAFTWRTSEILRLEPTQRSTPRGQLEHMHSLLDGGQLSALDRFIGTRTFGNTSLFENQVLFLGARTEFDTFLADTRFYKNGLERTLADLVSTGIVGESGQTEHDDRYNVAGQPFVAISPRMENIAAACALAKPHSKVVLVDGASRIMDLGKFDQIFERQNLIIFAESGDDEKLRQLHDRGCRFWRFSLADFELGRGKNASTTTSHSRGFFGPLVRAATNEFSCKIEPVSCVNEQLDVASNSLETCERALEESDTDETRKLLGKIYGVLMRCAGLVRPPLKVEREQIVQSIDRLSSAASERTMWLPEKAATGLREACEAIRQAVGDATLGSSKGDAVEAVTASVRASGAARIGVIVRNLTQHNDLTSWCAAHSLSLPVLLPASLQEQGYFDALICVSWPNTATFQRVLACHAAPTIYLVGYDFEQRWLAQFGRRRAQAFRVPSLGGAEKSELIGHAGDVSIAWPEPPSRVAPVEVAPVSGEFHISSFEEKITGKGKGIAQPAVDGEDDLVAATFVSFVGDAYAYLTASNKVPVITELVSGRGDESYTIPRRRIEQIKPGEVVVFREGGKRDVIHALADERMGDKAMGIRALAAQWQHSLRESNLSEAELYESLVAAGCSRGEAAVRNWLYDESMIGPQSESDVTAIARATGDETLLRNVSRVWQAMQNLKGQHQAAGRRLLHVLLRELPNRVGELVGGRTRIEIENTIGAWIVQVESIAPAPVQCPRSQVNSLLWDEGDDFF